MNRLSEQWHFSRPALATKLAGALQGHDRIAMFGPRQTGKTTLLRQEVMPRLQASGMLPIYIDCWADRSDAMGSINHALTKKLEEIRLAPGRVATRAAKTPVKKLGALGASIEFGDLAQRSTPKSPTLRFDSLLTQLIETSGRDLALIFDEFQSVAEGDDAGRMAAGIRAALTQADRHVGVIFSGSSEQQLLRMFTTSKAALYQFADAKPYPLLKEDFVAHVAKKFKAASSREINQVIALRQLEEFGHQPGPFLAVIGDVLANPRLSIPAAASAMLSAEVRSPWTSAWRELTGMQKAALQLVARGERPTAEASRQWAAGQLGKDAVPSRAKAGAEQFAKGEAASEGPATARVTGAVRAKLPASRQGAQ